MPAETPVTGRDHPSRTLPTVTIAEAAQRAADILLERLQDEIDDPIHWLGPDHNDADRDLFGHYLHLLVRREL